MVKYNGTRSDAEDIMECADTILSTVQGTMPYMRSMGIDDSVIGRNVLAAEEEYMESAIEQIETWEERAVVGEIEMLNTGGNGLEAKVVLIDGEDY